MIQIICLNTIRIITDKIILREINDNIYGYYEVRKLDEKVYFSNDELNWVPKESGNYDILHRVLNKSNQEVSESIINVDVLENYVEVNSVDYVFYSKKGKIIQIELPNYVLGTTILEHNFYIENNKLYGKLDSLKSVELNYSRGKIIVKPQIGDILDY